MPNKTIIAGSAITDKRLSDFAMENDIGGLEFLSCIPGTVGGGLRINSGCFGKEFKDILLSVQAIDKKGNMFSGTIGYSPLINWKLETTITKFTGDKGDLDNTFTIMENFSNLAFRAVYNF